MNALRDDKKMSRCLDPSEIPTGNSSLFFSVGIQKKTSNLVENYQ